MSLDAREHSSSDKFTDGGVQGKGKARSHQFSYGATGTTPVNPQNVPPERNSESLESVPEDEGPLAFGPVVDEAVDGEEDGEEYVLTRSTFKLFFS